MQLFRTVFLCLFLLLALSDGHAAVSDSKYPYHPNTKLEFTSSDLPVVMIDLDARMADKDADARVSATMKIIWDKSGGRNDVAGTEHVDYNGKIGIKYRGNSSFWNSDKKPFAIRTQNDSGKKKDASILGMPEDSDWALLAPFSDKSMMRDVLLFDLMRGTLDYVPTGKYCEVVLNGVYQGVYIMTARVRQGKNRIGIEAPTADEGDGLTGGYHLEIDRPDDPGFRGVVMPKRLDEQNISDVPYYQYKYPDREDLSTAQQNYIKNLVWNMEKAIAGEDFTNPETGYRAYIDTLSLINYYIAQEIAKNIDAYRLSTPLYKYPDSIDKRFKFSIWDFNISMGNANYKDGWCPEGWAWNTNRFGDEYYVPWMFKRLLQDEVFYSNIQKQWKEFRSNRFTLENIYAKIDSLTNLLQESQARNFKIWNRFGSEVWPNYYVGGSWSDEIGFLKNWLQHRVEWLDSQWIEEDPNRIVNGDFEASASPRAGVDARLAEWNTSGNVYLSTENKRTGKYALSIHPNSKAWQTVTELTPGKYTLRVWVKTLREPQASFYIKNYSNKQGGYGYTLTKSIEGNQPYQQYEISNFEVSNSFMEIGFMTGYVSGDIRLWVDDIELVKEKEAVSNEKVILETDEVQICADRDVMELTVSVDNSRNMNNANLKIYDMAGNRIYSSRIISGKKTIRSIFTRGKVYIVKVGSISKKVIF